MSSLPPDLLELAESIEPPASGADPSTAPTGLAGLQAWWSRVGGAGTPEAAWMLTDGLIADPVHDGIRAARDAAEEGATLIVPVLSLDVAKDSIAVRATTCVLANREASTVCPQPAGCTDSEWMATCTAIRDHAARLQRHRGEPLDLLRAAGSIRMSYLVGVLIAASAASVPVLLDGAGPLAAALIADRIAFSAKAWWALASTSSDPASAVAADRLMLEPLLDLGVDAGNQGARAALALLGAAT